MSKIKERKQFTVSDLRQAKGKRKLTMVTCYDYAFAQLVAKSNVDMVLVGDSLGNVVLGHDDTLPVTLEDMIHHGRAVARGLGSQFLAVDMPFGSYQVSVEEAVRNGIRVIKETGAQAVKVEGLVAEAVEKLTHSGVPVIAHLGLTPQHIHTLGGHRVQGRGAAAAELMKQAQHLQDAGAIALVLELVPAAVAAEVTARLEIPTIGIGAGPAVDAQVLVLNDMLGFDAEFSPKFLKKYANMGRIAIEALNQYAAEVGEGSFPSQEHSYE